MIKRRRTDSGASAVEFALISVPLIALLFGLIQYGLYFWAMQGGSDIARSAARFAAVGDPADCDGADGFRESVKGQIGGFGTDAGSTVTRQYYRGATQVTDMSTLEIGDTVKVRVRFKAIDMGFPFVPFINDAWVTQEAEARVDYIPETQETCS